jgi:deoxyribonuclease-4
VPLLGAHMSIAGGLHLAFARIHEVQGESLQIFLSNQRQWQTVPLTSQMVEDFRQQWKENDCMPVAAHDSYLISVHPETLVILGAELRTLPGLSVTCSVE